MKIMNLITFIFKRLQILAMIVVIAAAAMLLADHFGVYQTIKPYVVLSGSMEPALPVGSVAFVRPDSTYSPGDIISFNLNGKADNVVTHRVVFRQFPNGASSDPVYYTGGDANEELDQWEVQASQVQGKVVYTLPYLGYAVDFVKKPQGFILFVIVPATIVVYEELKNVLREFFILLKNLRKRASLRKNKKAGKIPTLNLLNKKSKSFPTILSVIPVLGALFIITAVTGSYFFDLDQSIGNVLSASSDYGDVTPTPTPTPASVESRTITLSNLGATSQYGYDHDYSGASVSFTFDTPAKDKLSGTLTATGLKPYETYQLKFEATPTCQDASGDDVLNEYIGYIGRWWDNTAGSNLNDTPANNDAFYLANSTYHSGTHCITGYLVWDFITADASGNATKSVETANSYHVLWCDGGVCGASNSNADLYTPDSLHPTVPFCPASSVFGQIERSSCGGMTLDPGTYHLTMILNEESFHQDSFGYWTAVMKAPIDFEISEDHLVINEFVANPDTVFTNEWVELYNPTTSPVNLTGWKLNDSVNNQKDLTPLGSVPAGGFAVYVYPGGDGWLNNPGNSVILLDPSLTVIDQHDYPSVADDEAIGREYDASPVWKTCTAPSLNFSNNGGC